jgi:hypothetical protein
MPANRPTIELAKPQARTRMGTGATALAGVDGRTHGGRRYKEICADLSDHLGGDVTAAQEAIIRRAAALAIWCEAQEAAQAQGDDLDIAAFTTASNALRRLLADLGLERRARDVTPDLASYIAGKAAP